MTTVCRREALWFLDILVRIHLPEDEAAPRDLYVMEHVMPQGFSPPLHIHTSEDEVFHLLSGEIRFQLDGEDIMVRPGETFMAPKNVPHSFVVTAPEGAHWLVMTRNGDFEQMVRQCSRPAETDGLPPTGSPSPDEMAALDAACRANAIELIGPPLQLAA